MKRPNPILFVVLGLCLGVFVGVVTHPPTSSQAESSSVDDQVTMIHRSPLSGIFTVKHEGHRFVIAYIQGHLTMVVHPDDGKAEKSTD